VDAAPRTVVLVPVENGIGMIPPVRGHRAEHRSAGVRPRWPELHRKDVALRETRQPVVHPGDGPGADGGGRV